MHQFFLAGVAYSAPPGLLAVQI